MSELHPIVLTGAPGRSRPPRLRHISLQSPLNAFKCNVKFWNNCMDEPATNEKSDPGAKADGRTSGIDTERRIAWLEVTFENE